MRRPMEDDAAAVGDTFIRDERSGMGVPAKFLHLGFRVISLQTTEIPRAAVLIDAPTAR